MSTAPDVVVAREKFFEYLFDEDVGYLCIATAKSDRTGFAQTFFEWPAQRTEAVKFVQQRARTRNVWFGVSLFSQPERSRVYSLPCSFLWADLDRVDYTEIKDFPPSCVLESSPGRYQAFWRLNKHVEAKSAQDINKRLTYHLGADKSGWDLEQILRIPITYNHKYDSMPEVKLLHAKESKYEVEDFDTLPHVLSTGYTTSGLPDPPAIATLPHPDAVAYKYQVKLHNTGFTHLYETRPNENEDWSSKMWRLINICIEVGMDDDEVFTIARNAACNKYERDNRPESYLWVECIKARTNRTGERDKETGDIRILEFPDLVEKDYVPSEDNFVFRYRQWAEGATDAVPAFHDLSAFIILSALVSSSVKLKATWGDVYSNLWGLILGDSTLSRKSTAMRMATDIIREIDETLVLSTNEGSSEGLFTGLNARPSLVSMFFKDEVSGFFDSIARKDYLAGMPELLTELYDVPSFRSRILRKETITVQYPYFIFFGGGIRDKVFGLIPEQFILSGFMPRFLISLGDTDLTRLRRTGPANPTGGTHRDDLVNELRQLWLAYNKEIDDFVTGQPTTIKIPVECFLTDDAWEFFGELEDKLTLVGYESYMRDTALPTFTRLAFSILKMAMLLAVSRQGAPTNEHKVTVTLTDLKDACYYGQTFGRNAVTMLKSAGISGSERIVEKILQAIIRRPGISKTEIMQRHKLRSREAKEILDTLLERGVISKEVVGNGATYYPVEAFV